mgnify:CR=1 FL=1
MKNKESSILNNDFYIFILILLLIIMLFMLSSKDKESFNVNISKINLNKIEPFQIGLNTNKTTNNNNFKIEVSDSNIFNLTINKDIVEDTYILKNDIIKLYSTTNKDIFYYFNVINVEYNVKNNYNLEIENVPSEIDINVLNSENLLNSVKVIGNKYKNCVLSNTIELKKIDEPEEGDYELIFDNKDNQGKLLIENNEKDKIMKHFNEDEVIEIYNKDIEPDKRLFLIKKKLENKIILINKEIISDNIIENIKLETKQILIKKFDLNDIIKEYYKTKKQFNINYLVTQNKIKNLGAFVDNINETMNL